MIYEYWQPLAERFTPPREGSWTPRNEAPVSFIQSTTEIIANRINSDVISNSVWVAQKMGHRTGISLTRRIQPVRNNNEQHP